MTEKKDDNLLTQVSDQFTSIAQDLFNIEVNIILRHNITAQKMPSPRHALLDIGKEYCAALEAMETRRQNYLRVMGQDTLAFDEDMFDVVRRKFDFLTAGECAARPDVDPDDYGRLISPTIRDELGGFDAFDVIRTWADDFLDDPNHDNYLKTSQLSVLPRIKDNSDLLKGLYSAICRRDPALNDPQLPQEKNLAVQLRAIPEEKLNPNTVVKLSKQLHPEHTIDLTNEYTRSDLVTSDRIRPLPLRDQELVLIRKVWELGTEVIAMQTIVQVDGDVITRLNPDFMDEEAYPRLHDYHNQGVNIALQHWASLVNVARELIVAAAKGISDRLAK
jgi:hypothetical protein